jgi:hypothetical protein
MPPDLLRALGKARHEDLLSGRLTRGQPRVRLGHNAPRFSRSRRWVDSLLIRVGARPVGDQRAALELVHE